MSRSGKNYAIPVSNGLFDHRRLIGAAIWVFLWLIDKTTNEVRTSDGKFEGIVNGGRPVPLNMIAADLDMSWDSIREQLAQLAAAGYIRKIFKGVGLPNTYVVINSKRFSKRRTSYSQTPGENPRGTPGEIPQGTHGENPRGPMEKTPGDPWRNPPPPLEKIQYVDKEEVLQEVLQEKNNNDHAHITPDIIARAVCDDCGLSGIDLMRTIGDVAKSELKQGKTADEVRSSMTEAWREHSAALADGKLDPAFSPGPDTFFGKGKWRTKATWKWLDGHKPQKSRRYWNGASA